MKRLEMVILVAIMLSLFASMTLAGDAEDLRAEDARLVRKIQGYNRLIAQANIRRAEIQGALKWLAQKEAEAEAENDKEKTEVVIDEDIPR